MITAVESESAFDDCLKTGYAPLLMGLMTIERSFPFAENLKGIGQ
jgi:hypothetical protein